MRIVLHGHDLVSPFSANLIFPTRSHVSQLFPPTVTYFFYLQLFLVASYNHLSV